jgi:hypothetical protein
MARTSAVELILRALPCTHPGCGAAPGGRCQSRNGTNKSHAHLERWDAAVAAGHLPIPTPSTPSNGDPQ